ncbi:hypothetical protein FOZ62_025728, partial [Perkinsus olseni]
MKDDGYRGSRKAMRRAFYIGEELTDRFLSVDSKRLLIDRWERIVWDTKKETFETFYLRFDYTRIDAQRGFPLTREDMSDRLFASFADDICEDILHKFGNSPTLDELIRRHGRSTVNAIESQVCDGDDDDYDAVATMPVTATTADATTNTDRLFRTNFHARSMEASYTATESDLLSAFRSILKVAGVAVSLLAEIVDSTPMSSTQQVQGTDQSATPPVTAEAQQRPEVPANVVSSVKKYVNLPADDVAESSAVNCVEGESIREVVLGHSDDSSACPSIDVRNLQHADGATRSKCLTSISTKIVAGDGTTTPMKWLLDSGCVAYFISSTVGNAFSNARSVQLDPYLRQCPFDDLMCAACRPGLPRLRPPDKEGGQILVDHVPASEGNTRARDSVEPPQWQEIMLRVVLGGTWYSDFCKDSLHKSLYQGWSTIPKSLTVKKLGDYMSKDLYGVEPTEPVICGEEGGMPTTATDQDHETKPLDIQLDEVTEAIKRAKNKISCG